MSTADEMVTGISCEMCGEPLDCMECEAIGLPAYCSMECAKDRGRGFEAVCNHEQKESDYE